MLEQIFDKVFEGMGPWETAASIIAVLVLFGMIFWSGYMEYLRIQEWEHTRRREQVRRRVLGLDTDGGTEDKDDAKK